MSQSEQLVKLERAMDDIAKYLWHRGDLRHGRSEIARCFDALLNNKPEEIVFRARFRTGYKTSISL